MLSIHNSTHPTGHTAYTHAVFQYFFTVVPWPPRARGALLSSSLRCRCRCRHPLYKPPGRKTHFPCASSPPPSPCPEVIAPLHLPDIITSTTFAYSPREQPHRRRSKSCRTFSVWAMWRKNGRGCWSLPSCGLCATIMAIVLSPKSTTVFYRKLLTTSRACTATIQTGALLACVLAS